MKKIYTILCFFITFNLYADEITLVADAWCPFNCDPASEKAGFLIDIAKYVFEKQGHTIKYEIVPWTRAIITSREGQFDGIIGASVDEAPDFLFPEVPTGYVDFCFYVEQSNNWKYNGIESLAAIELGVIKAYSYSETINKYIEKNEGTSRVTVTWGETALERNINAVINKRLSAVVESSMVLQYFMQSHPNLNTLQKAGCADAKQAVYIGFSPKTIKAKEYAKILNDGTKELLDSGNMQTIMQKYGILDWK